MEHPPRENRVMNAAKADKVRFAREQRREPTFGEALLWRHLRNGQLGARFRRQHPIEDFVLDFYCEEALLAVEVDGPQHGERRDYDEYRDARMQARGIRTLRVASLDVVNRPSAVVTLIRRALAEARELHPVTSGHLPLSEAERGVR